LDNLTDINDRVERLTTYVMRVNENKGYMLRLHNYMQGKEINPKFIEYNLTDERLDEIDKLTNVLIRYRAKMNLLGRCSFSIEPNILRNKVIFKLKCLVDENKTPDDQYFNEVLEILSDIDSLSSGLNESSKERLVYKNQLYSELSPMVSDINSCSRYKKNQYYNEIKRLCPDNKLKYISPLEYYNATIYDAKDLEGIMEYYKLSLILYVENITNNNDSNQSIKELLTDLKERINSLIKYVLYVLNNSHNINNFDSLAFYWSLGSDFYDVLELEMLYEIMSSRQILNTCKSMHEVGKTNYDIVESINKLVTNMYNSEFIYGLPDGSTFPIQNLFNNYLNDDNEKYKGKEEEKYPLLRDVFSNMCINKPILKIIDNGEIHYDVKLVKYKLNSAYLKLFNEIRKLERKKEKDITLNLNLVKG
jgi:hypothetical protein